MKRLAVAALAASLVLGCRSRREPLASAEPTRSAGSAGSAAAPVSASAPTTPPAAPSLDADAMKRNPLFGEVAEASELAGKEEPPPLCGVYAQGGNVFAKPPCPGAGGAAVKLTSTGLDQDPVESPDHQMIAFVRRPAGGEALAIWLMTRAGDHPAKVLDLAKTPIKSPVGSKDATLVTALFNLAFSADRKRLYFQTDGWGTSLALYAIDLDTRKTSLFLDANSYTMVTTCSDEKLKDHLIVAQHRYFKGAVGTYDWYWLFSPKGKEVGPIGPAAENVGRFLHKRCGVGEAVPDPPAREAPKELQKMPRQCGSMLITRKRTIFLDGTTDELYLVSDVSFPGYVPVPAYEEAALREVQNQCR